jgi:hypothetical protein
MLATDASDGGDGDGDGGENGGRPAWIHPMTCGAVGAGDGRRERRRPTDEKIG